MENEIAEVVRGHGWFSANVYDGVPPFVYTIGLPVSYPSDRRAWCSIG